jgi:hypothetical protein
MNYVTEDKNHLDDRILENLKRYYNIDDNESNNNKLNNYLKRYGIIYRRQLKEEEVSNKAAV